LCSARHSKRSSITKTVSQSTALPRTLSQSTNAPRGHQGTLSVRLPSDDFLQPQLAARSSTNDTANQTAAPGQPLVHYMGTTHPPQAFPHRQLARAAAAADRAWRRSALFAVSQHHQYSESGGSSLTHALARSTRTSSTPGYWLGLAGLCRQSNFVSGRRVASC
jgi:hypothetical protein